MSDDFSGTDGLRRPDHAGVPARHSPPRRAVICSRTAGPTSGGSRAQHAAQEDQCRQEADRLGLEVVAVVSDVGAPGTLQAGSEGWLQVEARIRSGEVEVVLISNFNRLTRS
jgi:hypothetical protein